MDKDNNPEMDSRAMRIDDAKASIEALNQGRRSTPRTTASVVVGGIAGKNLRAAMKDSLTSNNTLQVTKEEFHWI